MRCFFRSLAGMDVISHHPLFLLHKNKYGSLFCPKALSACKDKPWAKASPMARSHPPCYFFKKPSIPDDVSTKLNWDNLFSKDTTPHSASRGASKRSMSFGAHKLQGYAVAKSLACGEKPAVEYLVLLRRSRADLFKTSTRPVYTFFTNIDSMPSKPYSTQVKSSFSTFIFLFLLKIFLCYVII